MGGLYSTKRNILILSKTHSFYENVKNCIQDREVELFWTEFSQKEQNVYARYDLVIVDGELVGENIKNLTKILYRQHSTPILALFSHSDSKIRTAAFRSGVNAYLEIPYGISELQAITHSLMALSECTKETEREGLLLTFDSDLVIDLLQRQAFQAGKNLNLTRKEFDILCCLASHPGQVLSREQLYEEVWQSQETYHVDEVVKAHIKALRRKLSSEKTEYIKNIWGVGYLFLPKAKSRRF